jgi:hypothetical protein
MPYKMIHNHQCFNSRLQHSHVNTCMRRTIPFLRLHPLQSQPNPPPLRNATCFSRAEQRTCLPLGSPLDPTVNSSCLKDERPPGTSNYSVSPLLKARRARTSVTYWRASRTGTRCRRSLSVGSLIQPSMGIALSEHSNGVRNPQQVKELENSKHKTTYPHEKYNSSDYYPKS